MYPLFLGRGAIARSAAEVSMFRLSPGRITLCCVSLLIVAGCSPDDPSPVEPDSPERTATPAVAAAPLSFYQLSGGFDAFHTCGVTTANKAYCWGRGYLGNGPAFTEQRTTPLAVAGGLLFRSISAGMEYTCGVTTDNRAFCWGDNSSGQLGDGTTIDRPTPVRAASSLRFRDVQTGFRTTCGLTTGDRVYCWGASDGGIMGTGSTSTRSGNPPTQIAGGRTYNQVDVGLNHACAVTYTHEIYCWGDNHLGQLGDSTAVKVRFSPRRVPGTRSFAQVSVGWQHTCAVTTNKTAWCWGHNQVGQVGDGTQLNRWEPRKVAGGILFDRVSAGVEAVCGETTQNRVYCWGYFLQQNGANAAILRPALVPGGLFFLQVSVGNGYTCGVASNNRGYCWGNNYFGLLGDGTTANRPSPTAILGPT
jgi:alpha-tubulin suppressor-like RCC1 family protein